MFAHNSTEYSSYPYGVTMKRAAIYARVSTNGQSVGNQLRELKEAAKRHSWWIVATYIDDGISGAKGRDERPAFDALMKASMRREHDIVMSLVRGQARTQPEASPGLPRGHPCQRC